MAIKHDDRLFYDQILLIGGRSLGPKARKARRSSTRRSSWRGTVGEAISKSTPSKVEGSYQPNHSFHSLRPKPFSLLLGVTCHKLPGKALQGISLKEARKAGLMNANSSIAKNSRHVTMPG